MESTEEEKAAIDQQYSESYYQILAEWKEIDRIKKIIEKREHAKRVAESGNTPTSDSAEGHQVSRDATSVQQSGLVSIPETKPFSSSARPHSVSPGSRTSSPSLYSITPDNSSVDQDKELQAPTSTPNPSLHNGADSQTQPEISEELQEHVPHEPELGGQVQEDASESVNDQVGGQSNLDKLKTNPADSDLVDGTTASSPLKWEVQSESTDVRPSGDSEVENGVGSAELAVVMETIAQVEEEEREERERGEERGEGREKGADSDASEELLDSTGQIFAEELFKIDKDIPRCDRDYWYWSCVCQLFYLINAHLCDWAAVTSLFPPSLPPSLPLTLPLLPPFPFLPSSLPHSFPTSLFLACTLPSSHNRYFKEPHNLETLRNIVCTYVWTHLDVGYSQGMCDLLAPLLVILNNETQAYAVFLKLMEVAIELFPPNTAMNTRLDNLRELLQVPPLFSPPLSPPLSLSSLSLLKCVSLLCTQVLEPDYFQYLSERPLGDGLFYCYRWFLVLFKRGQSMGCTNSPPTHKANPFYYLTPSLALSHTHIFMDTEFGYDDIFRLWEAIWASRRCVSNHFEEFLSLAIMQQFRWVTWPVTWSVTWSGT